MSNCPKSIHCFLPAGHEGRCRDSAVTADGFFLDSAALRLVIRDDEEIIVGLCPGCGRWAELDEDQLHGRVSTHHDVPECGYHETKDWWANHAVRGGTA